jgi:uncharacterized protein (DUF1330 family)
MSSVTPSPESIQAFAAGPDKGPFIMVNLLKFRSNGGEAAYAEYSAAAMKMVADAGGRLVFLGRVEGALVGGDWDAIALVQYPSRQAFLTMVTSPAYLKIHTHREQGLERTELFAVNPGQAPAGDKL